jgi:hypothetical protein
MKATTLEIKRKLEDKIKVDLKETPYGKLYHIESVHTPAHPLTAAVVRTAIKEMDCVICWCIIYWTGSG